MGWLRILADGMARQVAPGLLLLLPWLNGCTTTPRLTAEDRREDIQYLAQWARDCSPLVALNEKEKHVPSCAALETQYAKFAGEAVSNEDFFLVASAYFDLIGTGSCHAYLFDAGLLKWSAAARCLGIHDWGISARRLWAATYWPRLAAGISTRAHPPFRLAVQAGRYVLEEDWRHGGGVVPRGSEIVQVNGLSCAAFLNYLKTKTSLRYDAFPKDWVDQFLLVIDEGPAMRGWLVAFRRPDGTTCSIMVPKLAGFPPPRQAVPWRDAPENCTCLELTDTVAYVRIMGMWHGPLSYVFKGYIKRERKRLRDFLQQGQGRYKQLIIDVRNNSGGVPEYVYENLVRPFLKGPITCQQLAGVRRAYLLQTRASALKDLRKQYRHYVTTTREVRPPAGFDEKDWRWYEITRAIRPAERYPFQGQLYVLINGGCMSAADDYADLVRRLKLGVLVGQNTAGGGGAYLAPGIIRLPHSGIVFRAETEILLTPDGQVDELYGTAPDIKLLPTPPPASITREALLKDAWIQHILARP